MKYLVVALLALISLKIDAQNTLLVFDNSPRELSNFDGDQMAFYDLRDGNKYEGEIIEPIEKYHANGQLAEKGLIVNNKPEGLWKKYDENGRLIAKINYKDGKKTGKWIIWNNDGQIIAKGRYNKEGDKTGSWIYWSSVDQKYLEQSF
jgi:antitoxin component YwqK of YwqJK toxin-antitoxin module